MKTKLILAVLAMSAATLHADTPVQLSLTPEIALFPKDTEVHGLSLSIWGQNPQQGLALGLINGSTGDSAGFSWGLANYDDSYRGVQFGWVNISFENYVGWQHGWVNFSQGIFQGLQSGLINVSETFTGCQLGIVNYAQSLHGVQLGLVNLAMNNQVFFTQLPDKLAPGFVILNWSF